MSFRSIGKKITHACPNIYFAGAKTGTPVYWTRRLLGFEYEKTGKKIARLYEKYGNAVVGKEPESAEYAYRIAAKYAPRWKAKLKGKEAFALEKRADAYEARAAYFEGMHDDFFRQDMTGEDSYKSEFVEKLEKGSRINVRRSQAYVLGVAAECLRLAASIYDDLGKTARSVLERAYKDVTRAEFILKNNLDFEQGQGFYPVMGLGTFDIVTVDQVSNLKRAIGKMIEETEKR